MVKTVSSASDRPHVVGARRQLGQRRRDIERRERAAGGDDRAPTPPSPRPTSAVEDRELQRQRLVGGAADPGLELGELGGARSAWRWTSTGAA